MGACWRVVNSDMHYWLAEKFVFYYEWDFLGWFKENRSSAWFHNFRFEYFKVKGVSKKRNVWYNMKKYHGRNHQNWVMKVIDVFALQHTMVSRFLLHPCSVCPFTKNFCWHAGAVADGYVRMYLGIYLAPFLSFAEVSFLYAKMVVIRMLHVKLMGHRQVTFPASKGL